MTLLSIFIDIKKIERGVFQKEEFKYILQKSQLILILDDVIMCDLWYYPNIQRIQSLTV